MRWIISLATVAVAVVVVISQPAAGQIPLPTPTPSPLPFEIAPRLDPFAVETVIPPGASVDLGIVNVIGGGHVLVENRSSMETTVKAGTYLRVVVPPSRVFRVITSAQVNAIPCPGPSVEASPERCFLVSGDGHLIFDLDVPPPTRPPAPSALPTPSPKPAPTFAGEASGPPSVSLGSRSVGERVTMPPSSSVIYGFAPASTAPRPTGQPSLYPRGFPGTVLVENRSDQTAEVELGIPLVITVPDEQRILVQVEGISSTVCTLVTERVNVVRCAVYEYLGQRIRFTTEAE